MSKIDIEYLKRNNCIIYEVISGSKAYGLNHADSDTDIRGVFVLSREEFYGFDYVEQVNDETNDTVYYEIKKFMKLLSKSNPSILEMIHTPEQFVTLRSPHFPKLSMDKILSKECFNTFARYAYSQVKKARGLNKKIVNPMDEKRKELIQFCTVVIDGKTVPLEDWLTKNKIDQKSCALINMDRCRDLFALYWEGNDNPHRFSGIIQSENATQLSTSSIPKGLSPKTYVSCNSDAYKRHCREYKEYWKWVDKRNDLRYSQTVQHGKNYDAKNMMHTFRLLAIAGEIVTERSVNVFRPDRDYLLSIKSGEYEYEDLLEMAEQKINEIEKLYENSDLQDCPDQNYIEQLLISIRNDVYEAQ